jgi:VanZ family protein
MLMPPNVAAPPTVQTPLVGLDKWFHMIGYTALAFALSSALEPVNRQRLLQTWSSTSVYGAVLELLQRGLPYRVFSLGDIAANAIGAAMGICTWHAVVVFRRYRST